MVLAPWRCSMPSYWIFLNMSVTVFFNKLGRSLGLQRKLMPLQSSMVIYFADKVIGTCPKQNSRMASKKGSLWARNSLVCS